MVREKPKCAIFVAHLVSASIMLLQLQVRPEYTFAITCETIPHLTQSLAYIYETEGRRWKSGLRIQKMFPRVCSRMPQEYITINIPFQ